MFRFHDFRALQFGFQIRFSGKSVGGQRTEQLFQPLSISLGDDQLRFSIHGIPLYM
jgi:hypothetical protein